MRIWETLSEKRRLDDLGESIFSWEERTSEISFIMALVHNSPPPPYASSGPGHWSSRPRPSPAVSLSLLDVKEWPGGSYPGGMNLELTLASLKYHNGTTSSHGGRRPIRAYLGSMYLGGEPDVSSLKARHELAQESPAVDWHRDLDRNPIICEISVRYFRCGG